MMMDNDKFKSILGGLGKPTLRGVRKCPECGVYNGTRGTSCKNKTCGFVFKENLEKKRTGNSIDAVKIVTGSNSQIYSVRIRQKSRDHRGFVQLPIISPLTVSADQLEDVALLGQPTACCFVESCIKTVLNSAQSNTDTPVVANPCQHVVAALNSLVEAQPLPFKSQLLNSLRIPYDMRQSIWALSNETTGPLVQRLSKQVMVVKCKISSKNPLGLLHVSFYENNLKRKEKQIFTFSCCCKTYKVSLTNSRQKRIRCVHFYSCLCSFASDSQLSAEFEQLLFLHLTIPISSSDIFPNSPNSQSPADNSHFVTSVVGTRDEMIVDVEITGEEVELLADTALLAAVPNDPISDASHEDEQLSLPSDAQFSRIKNKLDDPPECFTVQLNGDESSLPPFFSLADCASLLTPSTVPTPVQNEIVIQTKSPINNKIKIKTLKRPLELNNSTQTKKIKTEENPVVSQTFIDWLASITERINQIMHYQFSGQPETQVFHVPQVFFNVLQQRISAGAHKKRVPNTMTGFVRKDAIPLGTFTRYTWQIANILHVKSIFDTPQIPLEIVRRFFRNRDGTYELCPPPVKGNTFVCDEDYSQMLELEEHFQKTKKSPLIKPVEYKTLLKVGIMSTSQKIPYQFTIDWTPDILPQCQIGELRITFEYSHLKNGQIVNWKEFSSFAKSQEAADATATLTELVSSSS